MCTGCTDPCEFRKSLTLAYSATVCLDINEVPEIKILPGHFNHMTQSLTKRFCNLQKNYFFPKINGRNEEIALFIFHIVIKAPPMCNEKKSGDDGPAARCKYRFSLQVY